MDKRAKSLHDELIASQPPGVEHDEESCPFCSSVDTSIAPGGEMKTYTQEELDAAVSEALKPLEESLNELKAGVEQSEVEARIASEKAELEEQLNALRAELDTATLKAAEAEKAMDDFVAFLGEIAADEIATAESLACLEARLSRVEEVASFPEEYVAANAERWAKMSDEEFELLVSDWAAVSGRRKSIQDTATFPEKTAMVASRNEDKPESAVRELFDLTLRGIDPRTV